MATYAGPYRVPEASDDNAVPGDLVALADTIIPAMTTAAIDALSWARKPAGRFIAYDTTKGKLVRSTGAAMIDVLDANGGTITDGLYVGGTALRLWVDGAFAVVSSTGYNVSLRAGATQLNVAYAADTTGYINTNRQTQSSHPANAIVTKGYADAISSRFTADYVPIADFSGTPATVGPITLPAVPSGFTGWSVTASCQMVSSGNTASSQVSVGVVGTSLYLELAAGASSLVAGVHWQAIAY